MNTFENTITDTEILILIQKDKTEGWHYLYEKYALTMYVSILWVVNDERLAVQILSLLWVQLKGNKALLETKKTLSLSILNHALMTSVKIMRTNDIIFYNKLMHLKTPELSCVVYEPKTFMDVSENITQTETKVRNGKDSVSPKRSQVEVIKVLAKNSKTKPKQEAVIISFS
jgi:hypothetical protein